VGETECVAACRLPVPPVHLPLPPPLPGVSPLRLEVPALRVRLSLSFSLPPLALSLSPLLSLLYLTLSLSLSPSLSGATYRKGVYSLVLQAIPIIQAIPWLPWLVCNTGHWRAKLQLWPTMACM
jgi:hypothetical protein